MTMFRSTVLVFLLVCAGALGAAPLSGSVSFLTMSARDGLSNSSVSSIVQDQTGFLWFGTQGGLNRFDGTSFRHFTNEPFKSESLTHNLIQTMYLDGDVLWIGTYGGLNRFDLRTETFVAYRNDPEDEGSLSHDVVVSIRRDAKGRLWVGTLDGLNRLDEETGRFVRYMAGEEGTFTLPHKVVRSILPDAAGRLWVGTGSGMARWDEANDRFDRIANLPQGAVMSLGLDAERSTMWLGIWGAGLVQFDPETAKVLKVWPLEDNRVYSMDCSVPDQILGGTWGGGLFALDSTTGKIQRYRASSNRGALSHDTVYSFLRDRSGELWIGTNGGGVNKISKSSSGFETILANADDPLALPPGKIQAILVDRNAQLWVGVYNGGIHRWIPGKGGAGATGGSGVTGGGAANGSSGSQGYWKHYRNDPAKPNSLPNDIPNVIFENRAGQIWVGTNRGLARYRPETDDFQVIMPDPQNPAALSSEIIYCLVESPTGSMWVGTYQSGLGLYDPQKGTFTHYPHVRDDPKSISDGLVYAMAYDGEGRLWVGTNRGLNRMEADGSFSRYLYDPANRAGISSNSIRDLIVDSQGVLWAGSSGGGLMRYDREADSFTSYTKGSGSLPSNVVTRMLEDQKGNLWIATQLGLVTWNRATDRFQSLTVWNDLRDREFNTGGTRAPDGSLYLGSLGQVYRFMPEEVTINRRPPAVAVTGIEVAGQERTFDHAPHFLKEIRLRHDENSIRVGFAALDFHDPGRNRYRYMLAGFDREWSAESNGRIATYTNLPGGEYTFLVMASNSDGVWSGEEVALRVVVETAPWLSWPAILGYSVLVLFLVYQLIQIRSKRLLAAKVKELLEVKTQLEKANEQLAYLNGIDSLTGIANRRMLDETLNRVNAQAIRSNDTLAAIMIDIDHFKTYNDHFGHPAGDEILRQIAVCLMGALERSSDMVGRYGGEEFLVLLPNTDLNGASIVAEKLRQAVMALAIPHAPGHVSPMVTISLGVASQSPLPGDRPETLVLEADSCLYQAKTQGRNRVVSSTR